MPHYAALEPQGKGLMVASEKPFVFTHVDGALLEQPAAQAMEMESSAGGSMLQVIGKSYIGNITYEETFKYAIVSTAQDWIEH